MEEETIDDPESDEFDDVIIDLPGLLDSIA